MQKNQSRELRKVCLSCKIVSIISLQDLIFQGSILDIIALQPKRLMLTLLMVYKKDLVKSYCNFERKSNFLVAFCWIVFKNKYREHYKACRFLLIRFHFPFSYKIHASLLFVQFLSTVVVKLSVIKYIKRPIVSFLTNSSTHSEL